MVPLAIQPGAQRGLSCWFKEVTKPNEMAPDQMVRDMTDLRDKPREGQPWDLRFCGQISRPIGHSVANRP